MKVNVSLVMCIICIFVCSCAQETSVEDRMQRVLDKNIAKYEVNGVSASVIFPDGRVWNGVSGISHDAVPIETNMVFAIGSVTKNFVAALTLSLVEEGLLSLDDPLSKWLPDYPHIDEKITIRQLLNHTSGIFMFWDNQKIWDDLKMDRNKYWTPEEVLETIDEPYFDAGEGWRYSNTNYLLLAMIINQATGSNLSTELNDRFYRPLGLSGFYLSQEEALPADLAHVYSDNFEPGEPIRDVTFLPRTSHESITYGSSGIFTTAENLALWSHALFNGRVLEQQSMDEMLTFIKFRPVSNMRAYGLGVEEFTRDMSYGQRAIGHGGGNIGTTTYMVYLPEQHVSVVVMINAFPNDGAGAITKGLIWIILDDLDAFEFLPFIGSNILYVIIAASSLVVAVNVLRHNIKKSRKP